MKFGVVLPEPVPYVFGGAERLARGLVAGIGEHSEHSAELVSVPSAERTLSEVMEGYERFAALDVSRFDVVISTKYPSWMIDHPRHVVWMLHPLRGLYDTYGRSGLRTRVPAGRDPLLDDLLVRARRAPSRTGFADLFGRYREVAARREGDPDLVFPGPVARELVHALDKIGLDGTAVRGHLAISRRVASRAGYFPPATEVGVVHPDTDLSGLRCEPGEFLFSASRLDGPKRVDLLVRAMEFVSADVQLRIAGTGPDADRLRALAAADPRIELVGHIDDAELVESYARAIAVPFVPEDEDFGYIALEAMRSAKPVVTTTDAGGPTELVIDGVHGRVVAPEPEALGRALDALVLDRAAAAEMGARAQLRAAQVSWPRIVATLVRAAERPARVARRPGRPKVVVTTTFAVHPPLGGGQLRAHHLYGALTTGADRDPDGGVDVEIVSLAGVGTTPSRATPWSGFSETVVPKSDEHEMAELAIGERVAGLPITDITASSLARRSLGYVDALTAALSDADAVLLAHPFLLPLVRELRPDLPFVYDAQDSELVLKDSILPRTPVGDALRELVRVVEHEAVQGAVAVSVCSEADGDTLRTEYGDAHYEVVANGVDVAMTPFVTGARRRRMSDRLRAQLPGLDGTAALALFIASWHPPNIRAVEQLFRIAERRRDVGFVLAGSVCAYPWPDGVPDNVTLFGVVRDDTKHQLLAGVDLALNPMTEGTGTNLKLLEYFASGIPTVSTPVGARGIAARHEREVLLAEIAGFPDAIGRLLDAPAFGSDLAQRARSLVAAEYDWSVLGRRLLNVVCEGVPGISAACG